MTAANNKTRTKCILIVDDDVDFASALKGALEKHGFRVIMAHDPSTASQFLFNQRFACTLVDYHIGGVSGATLLTLIKQNPYHMNYPTPFIFMTGDPDTKVLKKIAKDIVWAFVKPFTTRELIDKIVEAADGRSVAAQRAVG